MTNGGWRGDLNAAKDFHSKVVHHSTMGDNRRGHGGARGGRGGSYATRGSSNFANTSSITNDANGRRSLATAPPPHFWEPVNNYGTQNTHTDHADERGDPMNIDDRGMGGSQWAPETHATAHPDSHTGAGSVPTSASWVATVQPTQPAAAPGSTTASWDISNGSWGGAPPRAASGPVRISYPEPSRPTISARDRDASPPRGLGTSLHAAVKHSTAVPGANGAIESQSANTEQGMASAAEAGRPWPGLNASCHADLAGPVRPARHRQDGVARRDLLQANGQLVGVRFYVDQGPQQDDDWLKTYGLNQVKNKCITILDDAHKASDHEAENALRRIIDACNEVLRAKNELKDKQLTGEADKVLRKSQHEAWAHWIKYYRPVTSADDPAAPTKARKQRSDVQMKDVSVTVPQQVGHLQASRTRTQVQTQDPPAPVAASAPAPAHATSQRPKFGSVNSSGSDPISFQQQPARTAQHAGFDYTPSGGFGSSNPRQMAKSVAQQPQVAPEQCSRTAQIGGGVLAGGFDPAITRQDTASGQQPQPAQNSEVSQQANELTRLPAMFPQGLPPDFDNAEARRIYEDLFFQDKRLPRK